MKMCEYGCGKEAKYITSSGAYCCSDSYRKCIHYLEKNKNSNTGKKHDKAILIKNDTNILCNYCFEKANYKFKNGKYCCSISKNKCKENRKKNSLSLKNSSKFLESRNIVREKNKGKKRTEEFCREVSKQKTGSHHSKETKIKIGKKSENRFVSDETREKHRQYMLNGGAAKALKGMKKISKEEIKLRDLVKELYSDCEFQFPVFNYSLDVAIPEYKIAIEFDGYYHFNCQENIDYHTNRRNKIINEGWKFYRVTMFDKFPTLEEVKENIERLINDITTK